MKYELFEDLPVWKDAIELAVQIFALMEDEAFKGKGILRDQIERAAVSISNNIAEGFERGTTQELITFIYIARGSAGEVRSMFHLFSRLPKFSNLKSQISDHSPKASPASCEAGRITCKIPTSKASVTSTNRLDLKINEKKNVKNPSPNGGKCAKT